MELAEYTPYGSLNRREGSTNVPQKFTGKRLDPTGLYFYEARYYDPELGRFLTADPTVQRPGDPQDLNRYAYCRNNPVTYVDPSGYGWFKKFWRGLVGAVSALVSVFVPPLAPALWAVNLGISAATAIQSGSIGGFLGGLVGELVRQSPVLQRAIVNLGLEAASGVPLVATGPRSQHTYVTVDTTDHFTQTVLMATPASAPSGDLLLELHPFGMDYARGERFVDVELALNGQFLKTARFLDRRGTGTVDVGSVYVPVSQAMLAASENVLAMTWAGGERWVQLQDLELDPATGNLGSQDIWEIGRRDGSFHEFGDERLVNESYLVGDDPRTFEQALNVVDEPMTDILFELTDVASDRVLRLVADETQDARDVTVEVSVNGAIVQQVIVRPGEEAAVDVPHVVLREGWNHLRLRHANMPGDGEFVLWDAIAFDRQTGAAGLQVLARNVHDDQLAANLHFGLAPPEGAVMAAQQYLEIHYQLDDVSERLTISTDNRRAPAHPFTGPPGVSAAGLVGLVDSTITAPLLWQVYDERQPSAPAFTDTVAWAFVPDVSDPDFGTTDAIQYRTLARTDGLGDRPNPGRAGSSPVAVYLVTDLRGKPAQAYTTDRIVIEVIQQ